MLTSLLLFLFLFFFFFEFYHRKLKIEFWVATSIFYKNLPKNSFNIRCRPHYIWSKTKNRNKNYELIKVMKAKFLKTSPRESLFLWNILNLWNFLLLIVFSSNCFNRNCFIDMYYHVKKKTKFEKISFLLVPRKFPKFSNLRKFVSLKCKNVTIWPKTFFIELTEN